IHSFDTGVSGAVQRSDIAVVPAVPQASLTTRTTEIPFFAQEPNYFTDVQIDNISNVRQTLSVTAKRSDGSLLPATNNPASIVLPTYGSVRQELATMIRSTATGFATGTITITAVGSETNGKPTAGPPAPITAAAAIGNITEPRLAVVLPSTAQSNFALQLR